MSKTTLINFKGETAKYKFEVSSEGYLHLFFNDLLIDTIKHLGKITSKMELNCAVATFVNMIGGELV